MWAGGVRGANRLLEVVHAAPLVIEEAADLPDHLLAGVIIEVLHRLVLVPVRREVRADLAHTVLAVREAVDELLLLLRPGVRGGRSQHFTREAKMRSSLTLPFTSKP